MGMLTDSVEVGNNLYRGQKGLMRYLMETKVKREKKMYQKGLFKDRQVRSLRNLCTKSAGNY